MLSKGKLVTAPSICALAMLSIFLLIPARFAQVEALVATVRPRDDSNLAARFQRSPVLIVHRVGFSILGRPHHYTDLRSASLALHSRTMRLHCNDGVPYQRFIEVLDHLTKTAHLVQISLASQIDAPLTAKRRGPTLPP